jgi:hypothetical protein
MRGREAARDLAARVSVPAVAGRRLSYRRRVTLSAGLGAVLLAVVAMLCAVVASSFSDTAAAALSFVAFAAAVVGFYGAAAGALRAR